MEDLNQNPTNVEETTEDSFLEGFEDNDTPIEEDNLFEDETEVETDGEQVEEPQEEPKETETETESVDNDDFLTIRYNKEDKNLTKDEAIALSQKGMNYDKVKAEYDSLNGKIDQLARMNGMTNDEFMNKLFDMQTEFAMNKEMQTLKEQYPNAEQELLEEVARKKLDEEYEQIKQTEQQEQDAQANAQHEELKHQLEEFAEEFPNVDASKLDDEVYELMKQGKPLLTAYLLHERKVQKANSEKSQKIANQNTKTKAKSYGNTTSVASDEDDAFMSGFNFD